MEGNTQTKNLTRVIRRQGEKFRRKRRDRCSEGGGSRGECKTLSKNKGTRKKSYQEDTGVHRNIVCQRGVGVGR